MGRKPVLMVVVLFQFMMALSSAPATSHGAHITDVAWEPPAKILPSCTATLRQQLLHRSPCLCLRGGRDKLKGVWNEVIVPDDVPSLPAAIHAAVSINRPLHVRAGNHTWQSLAHASGTDRLIISGCKPRMRFVPKDTSDVDGISGPWSLEAADNTIDSILQGMWLLEEGSHGAFCDNLVLHHMAWNGLLTDSCMVIESGPWFLDSVQVACSNGGAIECAMDARVDCSDCVIGGLSDAAGCRAAVALFLVERSNCKLTRCTLGNVTGSLEWYRELREAATKGELQELTGPVEVDELEDLEKRVQDPNMAMRIAKKYGQSIGPAIRAQDVANALVRHCRIANCGIGIDMNNTARLELRHSSMGLCGWGSVHGGSDARYAALFLAHCTFIGSNTWIGQMRPGPLGDPNFADDYCENTTFYQSAVRRPSETEPGDSGMDDWMEMEIEKSSSSELSSHLEEGPPAGSAGTGQEPAVGSSR